MRNYQTTIKFTLGIIIVLQLSMVFFGFLRPSILYDYLDYWPLIIFPLVVLIGTRNTEYKEQIIVYSYSFLSAVSLFFHMAHLLEANFLTTYSYDSDFENLNLDENFEYQPKESTNKYIWRYLSSANLIEIDEIENEEIILTYSPIIPLYYDMSVRLKQKNIVGLKNNALNMLDLKQVYKK